MPRGHECDVAGRPNNDLVRPSFVDYIRLSPTKQNASLYFVLHSYFIPTRLQSTSLLLYFVLHSYFIPTRLQSKPLLLYFVLHSYFIPTRLQSKPLLLYFVLHSYFIHTRLFGIRCKSLYVEHVRFGDLVGRSCFIHSKTAFFALHSTLLGSCVTLVLSVYD